MMLLLQMIDSPNVLPHPIPLDMELHANIDPSILLSHTDTHYLCK
jgi:hypothetical protein